MVLQQLHKTDIKQPDDYHTKCISRLSNVLPPYFCYYMQFTLQKIEALVWRVKLAHTTVTRGAALSFRYKGHYTHAIFTHVEWQDCILITVIVASTLSSY